VVTFTTDLGSVGSSSVTKTTTDGVATAELTSTDAGTATVMAQADSVTDTATVVFNPGAPYTVTLEANPTTDLELDETSYLTATVVDEYNNDVADGTTVTFTTDLGSVSPATDDTEDGKAYATLTSDEGGTATVMAQADSVTDTATVVFKPGTGTLAGTVELDGHETSASWSEDLTVTVKLSQTGSVSVTIAALDLITDSAPDHVYGVFTIPELDPGAYDVWVKGPHSLAQCEDGVAITAGMTTTQDFGILLEGDANDDNLIDIVDFSIWKSLFGESDTNADFNDDGLVDIVDFSIWKKNFGETGCPDPSG
jgi:hypothetical protein